MAEARRRRWGGTRAPWRRSRAAALAALAALALGGFAAGAAAQTVHAAAGPDVAAIAPARDAFRAHLGGGTTPGPNGSFGGVRREINWDAVPDGLASPRLLPADFFNLNSPRGVVFAGPVRGFAVSARAADPAGTPPLFANFDPLYGRIFAAFSPERLFVSLGSPVYDVRFFVPGTNRPAVVSGFGAVFTDVDGPDSTWIETFAADGASLGRFRVPAFRGDKSFSFLGVAFPGEPRVAWVRIGAGDHPLDEGGEPPRGDAVAADDFLYSEPIALAGAACVPTPTALCLERGRFRVEARFDTGGAPGVARVASRTREAGTFTFFSPDNLELIVKVLNGCEVNDRYWVFAAAATTLEYSFTVTDTVFDQVKRYAKPLGPPAPAVTDLDGFPGCRQ